MADDAARQQGRDGGKEKGEHSPTCFFYSLTAVYSASICEDGGYVLPDLE